jgi:hypothetical protein
MLRPDHRYQAWQGRTAVEAGRPGVAGKLVIGDHHEINAADAGGQAGPPGPVEDLGGTQAPRYIPRCGAAPSPRPARRRQTGVSPGRRHPAHADDAGGARDAARLRRARSSSGPFVIPRAPPAERQPASSWSSPTSSQPRPSSPSGALTCASRGAEPARWRQIRLLHDLDRYNWAVPQVRERVTAPLEAAVHLVSWIFDPPQKSSD